MTQSEAHDTLARFLCHKMVSAGKIVSVTWGEKGLDGHLVVESATGEPVTIDAANTWLARHQPMAGGYYVFYDDGYVSYSPAEPFEAGYTQVPA